jgi:hypothetical protein
VIKLSVKGIIGHRQQHTITIIIWDKTSFTTLSRGMLAGAENMYDDEQMDHHKPVEAEDSGCGDPA